VSFVECFGWNISCDQSLGEGDDFCDYETSFYVQFTALNWLPLYRFQHSLLFGVKYAR